MRLYINNKSLGKPCVIRKNESYHPAFCLVDHDQGIFEVMESTLNYQTHQKESNFHDCEVSEFTKTLHHWETMHVFQTNPDLQLCHLYTSGLMQEMVENNILNDVQIPFELIYINNVNN